MINSLICCDNNCSLKVQNNNVCTYNFNVQYAFTLISNLKTILWICYKERNECINKLINFLFNIRLSITTRNTVPKEVKTLFGGDELQRMVCTRIYWNKCGKVFVSTEIVGYTATNVLSAATSSFFFSEMITLNLGSLRLAVNQKSILCPGNRSSLRARYFQTLCVPLSFVICIVSTEWRNDFTGLEWFI